MGIVLDEERHIPLHCNEVLRSLPRFRFSSFFKCNTSCQTCQTPPVIDRKQDDFRLLLYSSRLQSVLAHLFDSRWPVAAHLFDSTMRSSFGI